MSRTFLSFAALLIAAPAAFAADPIEIRLWPSVAPGSECAGNVTEIVQERGTPDRPDRRFQGVTVPAITVYRPDPGMNTGTAIVICPGGGYNAVVIDKEGHEIARYLESIGVTAIVLKYRLPRPEGFIFDSDVPWLDASRAVRQARDHAAEWDLDADRIGIMGFSAGGHLASTAATRFDSGNNASADPVDRHSSRPDFQALIYPVISFRDESAHSGSRRNLVGNDPDAELVDRYSSELQVTEQTPPAFLLSTYDDHVKAENILRYFEALRAVDVPAEMHVYEVGGHGYGIRPTGKPVSTWHHRLTEWMQARGLLDPK
jgi:acetyl esterase/lipase